MDRGIVLKRNVASLQHNRWLNINDSFDNSHLFSRNLLLCAFASPVYQTYPRERYFQHRWPERELSVPLQPVHLDLSNLIKSKEAILLTITSLYLKEACTCKNCIRHSTPISNQKIPVSENWRCGHYGWIHVKHKRIARWNLQCIEAVKSQKWANINFHLKINISARKKAMRMNKMINKEKIV